MFVNLLAAIEADINQTAQKLQEVNWPANNDQQYAELAVKKQKLRDLAMGYINLQNQYREISGANSIY